MNTNNHKHSMRFTRLELKNWKNFTIVDAQLTNRVFLIGPNASGKSNFLDSFRFLRDLVDEGGGLAKAVDLRGGLSKVRSLYARQAPKVLVSIEAMNDDGVIWKYYLSFTGDGTKYPKAVVAEERVVKIDADGIESTLLNRPDSDDKRDKERLKQTAIQQVNANQEFRELAEFFKTISYLHLVPQLLREEQKPNKEHIGHDAFGRDLLDRMRNTAERFRKGRLAKIQKVLTSVSTQIAELNLETDDHGHPHLVGKFKHWRPQGAYQNETQFSDGTLRLIGLLWALQEKGGPLLLEEPELSLHAEIVKKLAPFIFRAQKAASGRQVILSTHSENLLRDEGISAEEVLLIQPADEGSRVIAGANVEEIKKLMDAGLSASEAILPKTITKEMNLFDTVEV